MPERWIVEPEETTIARQRVGKHVPVAMNTHTAIEELLDMVFSVWSVSDQIVCRQLVPCRTSCVVHFKKVGSDEMCPSCKVGVGV
jgi:hypothetical protein